jgi:glycolate oxidase iron-sulfur subunit
VTPLLPVDDAELNACVACGLCLPHCPTYRVTGRESASPRGRIAAMQAVQLNAMPIDENFERYMEECVQCRGCEAACPSSVPFGRLMEGARVTLAERRTSTRPRTRRIAEWFGYAVVLPRHWLLIVLTWFLLVAQRLRLVPQRFSLPRLSARSLSRPLRPTGTDAWLFPGCVMDAWQRDTHRSALRVLEAAGIGCALPGPGGDCCGALHGHAGRRADAQRLAQRVIASMPGEAPIVVDSAGCGATMKEYGELLDTPEARAFAARVRDFSEFLAQADVLPVAPTHRPVVVQDPCHLRHVQRAHGAVRAVLAPAYDLLETDDDGLCCGAGGAYAALQPDLAGEVRDRKVAAIRRAGGDTAVVASANPGCAMHLAAAGLDVRHPAQLLEEALDVDR